MKGVLFDLDETLVLTSAIEPYRRRRDWAGARAALHLTRMPTGTREFLEALADSFRIGVVTMAPRPYAQGVIAHHDLRLPVLTAFHDTKLHKPHPDPLFHACRTLNLDPSDCVYVGDEDRDDIAAAAAGMRSIRVSWVGPQEGAVTSWPEVQAALAIWRATGC